MAIVLPLLYIAAIIAIPERIVDQQQKQNQAAPLPRILISANSSLCIVYVRSDASGTNLQLEIMLKKPLTEPEALVYLTPQSVADKVLIGKLNSTGVYRFALKSGLELKNSKVEFFNPLSNSVFHSITL
ncbi:MAG TPA: hypothetical protein VI603_10840 [Saprospiraceae bacterium]|nr:hypothetical protein [Saprospiraceae bacterium]